MRQILGGVMLAVMLTSCAAFQSEPPRDYIVFFDYNTADLSPSGRDIVANAAATAKSLAATRIDLVGYTGREKDARTDDKLADARFAHVEDALAAAGLSRSLFKRSALMDSVPLPDTSVRRIEIHLIAPDPR